MVINLDTDSFCVSILIPATFPVFFCKQIISSSHLTYSYRRVQLSTMSQVVPPQGDADVPLAPRCGKHPAHQCPFCVSVVLLAPFPVFFCKQIISCSHLTYSYRRVQLSTMSQAVPTQGDADAPLAPRMWEAPGAPVSFL
ncbi:hypothetical protein J6590_014719 [Homalodisca vitripennis]|nr:hypothetical protein J6590_014719 [Homalodisca vitripennis]